jgi:LRR receptor-like serine/threonine-protein kinase FLS2
MGTIPYSIGYLTKIEHLLLHENNLSRGIPQTLSNLSSFQELSLTYNMLSNTLLSNFGHALPNLKLLYLTANFFEGQIPHSLGNVSSLVYLDMSFNKFTSKIPSILCSLRLEIYE